MKKSTITLVIILVVVAIVALVILLGSKPAGVGVPNGETGDNQVGGNKLIASNAIFVSDQEADQTANIDSVILEEKGYVVIHEDNNGAPGNILNASELLEAGEYSNVEVSLHRIMEAGETLYAMLHYSDDDTEFVPANDMPIVNDEGDPIFAKFKVLESEADENSAS